MQPTNTATAQKVGKRRTIDKLIGSRAVKARADVAGFHKLSPLKLTSIDVAAIMLDVTPKTVYGLIKRGELATVRVGRTTKLRVGDIRVKLGA
jgi:excisionase family DNA binding protein